MSTSWNMRQDWIAKVDWLEPTANGVATIFGDGGSSFQFYGLGGLIPWPDNFYVKQLSEALQRELLGNPTIPKPLSEETLCKEMIKHVNERYFRLLYGFAYPYTYIAPDGAMNYQIIPGHFLLDLREDLGDDESNISNYSNVVEYGPRIEKIQPGVPVIYVIGAEPSFVESVTGVNFSGDFGDALLNALESAGVDDQQFSNIYTANSIRIYRAPTSIKSKLIKDFLPLIQLELAILQPDHIICLGSQALKIFTRKSQATVSRTPVEYTYTTWQGEKKAIVHALPLTALHSISEYKNFQLLVRRTIDFIYYGKTVQPYDVKYSRIDTASQLKQYVSDILEAAKTRPVRVSVDLEWNGIIPLNHDSYIRTINLASNHTQEPAVAVAVLTAPGGAWTFNGTKAEIASILQPLFIPDNNIQIVGHNFIADIPWLLSLGVDVEPKFWFPKDNDNNVDFGPNYPGIFDTIIAYHAIDECGQFGLEHAARIWLDFPEWSQAVDEEMKKNKGARGYGFISEEILLPYAATDAYVTLKLAEVLSKGLYRDVFGNNCWGAYWRNLKSQLGFLEMNLTGVCIDSQRALQLGECYNTVRDRLLSEFRDEINWPTFNFQSWPQCVELLYGEKYHGKSRMRPEGAISFNLTPIKTTDDREWDVSCIPGKVSPSTDLDTLNNLIAQDERVRKLRDIRVLNQVTKTILPNSSADEEPEGILAYVCDDGRIHPFYSALKETRRCSCSKPNLQNLPNSEEDSYKQILGDLYIAPIRSMIVAPPGYSIVEVDYSGAELLMIGVAAQDKNLINDYYLSTLPDDDPNKLDIHSQIAVLAFNLNCAPNKKALKEAGKLYYRLAAKQIIFGLNYGRGVKSCYFQLITEGVDVTQQDVAKIVDTIYTRYDKIYPFQDSVKLRVRTHRWLANCFGSYRRFFISRSSDVIAKNEREAMNFVCQSGVADAVAIAMYNFYKHPSKRRIGYKFIMHNHDALVFVVPDQNVRQFTEEVVRECMQEQVQFRSCNLDGVPYENSPYYKFELEWKIGKRWCSED